MIIIKKNINLITIFFIILISFLCGYVISDKTTFEINVEGIYNKKIKNNNDQTEIDQILNIYIKNPIILDSNEAYKKIKNKNPDIKLQIKSYSSNVFPKHSLEVLTSYIWFLDNGEAIITIPNSNKEYNLFSESELLSIEWRKLNKADISLLKPILE